MKSNPTVWTWEEILAEEIHPTLKAGVAMAFSHMKDALEAAADKDTRYQNSLLNWMGYGASETAFYLKTMEHALSALNSVSLEHADEILRESCTLLIQKNRDYGSSVFDPGPFTPRLDPKTAALVRLGDKYNRLKTLRNRSPEVNESVKDTIRDVIGYSVILCGMSIVEGQRKAPRL